MSPGYDIWVLNRLSHCPSSTIMSHCLEVTWCQWQRLLPATVQCRVSAQRGARFGLHVPEGLSLACFARSYLIYSQDTVPDTGACLHKCPVVDFLLEFLFKFLCYWIDLPKMDYQEYLSSFKLVPLLSFMFLFSCEVPDAELSEWAKNALAVKCKGLALMSWKVCGCNVGQQIKHLPIEQKYRSKGTY